MSMRWATMTNPRFSIVTVTKNNLAGLQKTHASLIAQNYTRYEWLVIDGGSTDGTLSHFTPDLSEPDHGIYDAMNKGIDRADGDYILFLNAGDTLASSDILERLASLDADFLYGDSRESDRIKRAYHDITRGMMTHHQAMVYRRAAIGDLRFDTRYKIAADYDFTRRFLQRTSNALYVPAVLCDFESGGLSQKQALLGRREQFSVRRALGASLKVSIHLYIRQTLAQNLRRLAPDFFWRVKSRYNNEPSPAHNPALESRPETLHARHSHTKIPPSREAA